MKITKISKQSFTVLGLEGSTEEGKDFVQRLWQKANARFSEIKDLASKDSNGNLIGLWGAMSDPTRSFQPWTDGFKNGLYLAGVECPADTQAPNGWTTWTLPGFEYLVIEVEGPDAFTNMCAYMKEHQIPLAGAVQDFTDPKTGINYMYFPIQRL